MEILRKGGPRSGRTFPRWLWLSLLCGVLLLITGFITFLPTIGHGDGELQIFAMTLGAVVVLLALVMILISFVSRYVKKRV
jgi:drug/metabolite transporter (DMT)-like permease